MQPGRWRYILADQFAGSLCPATLIRKTQRAGSTPPPLQACMPTSKAFSLDQHRQRCSQGLAICVLQAPSIRPPSSRAGAIQQAKATTIVAGLGDPSDAGGGPTIHTLDNAATWADAVVQRPSGCDPGIVVLSPQSSH